MTVTSTPAEPKAAARFDYRAFWEKHFEAEQYWAVQAAAFAERCSNGRRYPDPAAVKDRMEKRGWTLAQRKALP
jgi:hypothetical protein